MIDCISDLHVAVLYAFAAVESLANHSIDQLDDTAVIEIEFKKGEPIPVLKAEMVRRLNLEEKLTRAVPLLPDGANIKGTRRGKRYVYLKRLRDELVHVKERGYSPDPDEPTAYDRLVLGHGDDCVEECIVGGCRCQADVSPGSSSRSPRGVMSCNGLLCGRPRALSGSRGAPSPLPRRRMPPE